ncbi:MAG: hypothetical protein WC675_03670 [Patescibacteria group bacterium]|jgi:VIT1/CCC1 family predicted Fe2+/Mn2+ transporter
MVKKFQFWKNKFFFGSTSAIITNLALIAGLDSSLNAKINIIASILMIAIADNISDSLGIHIYQEAEGLNKKEVWTSSLSNFLARFFLSIIFIIIVILLPLNIAVIGSIIFGLSIIAIISYEISIHKGENPYKATANHLIIAAVVIFISSYLGDWISQRFNY